MPSLRETADLLHGALRGTLGLSESAQELGVSPTRLAVYVDFVRGHVDGILAKQYPRVKRSLSPSVWRALCEAYYATHPPQDWELNQAAEPFARFLASRLGQGDELTLFHVSMATLEWAQWEAYSDLRTIPAPGSLEQPIINPTLSILELPCPIIDAALQLDRGEALSAQARSPSAEPERVLVFRQPLRETGAFWRASEALIIALATLDAGLTPEAMAEQLSRPIEVVTQSLERANEIGLIIGYQAP